MPALLFFSALVTTATVGTSTTAREEDSVVPDRPGFADGTRTVPKGRVELELGVRGSFESEATDVQGPSALLRLGLTDHLELRVGAPDVVLDLPSGDGDTSAGVTDMVLGVKLAGGIGDSFGV